VSVKCQLNSIGNDCQLKNAGTARPRSVESAGKELKMTFMNVVQITDTDRLIAAHQSVNLRCYLIGRFFSLMPKLMSNVGLPQVPG